jgi:hypothetical protein
MRRLWQILSPLNRARSLASQGRRAESEVRLGVGHGVQRGSSPGRRRLRRSPACGPQALGDGPAATAELRGAASVQQDVRPR